MPRAFLIKKKRGDGHVLTGGEVNNNTGQERRSVENKENLEEPARAEGQTETGGKEDSRRERTKMRAEIRLAEEEQKEEGADDSFCEEPRPSPNLPGQ